jgi:hypothetical protein
MSGNKHLFRHSVKSMAVIFIYVEIKVVYLCIVETVMALFLLDMWFFFMFDIHKIKTNLT